jgi:hypothetical protein
VVSFLVYQLRILQKKIFLFLVSFSKYASILASQGSVEIAMEYLMSANDQVYRPVTVIFFSTIYSFVFETYLQGIKGFSYKLVNPIKHAFLTVKISHFKLCSHCLSQVVNKFGKIK